MVRTSQFLFVCNGRLDTILRSPFVFLYVHFNINNTPNPISHQASQGKHPHKESVKKANERNFIGVPSLKMKRRAH